MNHSEKREAIARIIDPHLKEAASYAVGELADAILKICQQDTEFPTADCMEGVEDAVEAVEAERKRLIGILSDDGSVKWSIREQ